MINSSHVKHVSARLAMVALLALVASCSTSEGTTVEARPAQSSPMSTATPSTSTTTPRDSSACYGHSFASTKKYSPEDTIEAFLSALKQGDTSAVCDLIYTPWIDQSVTPTDGVDPVISKAHVAPAVKAASVLLRDTDVSTVRFGEPTTTGSQINYPLISPDGSWVPRKIFIERYEEPDGRASYAVAIPTCMANKEPCDAPDGRDWDF